MPAWRTARRIGVKLVTVFPGNARRGQSAVGAVYALFDAGNGAALALFDGEEITARRTAGASAYAASRLARKDAKHLVIVGSGRIARELADAHCFVRPIERVSVWSRTVAHARATAADAHAGWACGRARSTISSKPCARPTSSPARPCRRRHSSTAIGFSSGVHLDLVGAFRADMRETDDAALANADVIVVDRRDGALREGGDVVQAIRSGALSETRIAADLADLARGAHPGRTRAGEITVFKSVGFALEDLAAAEAVFDAADETAADAA